METSSKQHNYQSKRFVFKQMTSTAIFLVRTVFINIMTKACTHTHTHTHTHTQPFCFSVISTLVATTSCLLSPLLSHFTDNPSIPTSSLLSHTHTHTHTHTPGSYLPSPVFAAHLSPKYETHASWNIPPPWQPLNSHYHKTTSTTFPRPHSSSPTLQPLPLFSNSQNPPYRYLTAYPSAGGLLFLLVSHSPAQCICKTSFILLSASHVAGIIPLWYISHACSNWCHFFSLLCFLV